MVKVGHDQKSWVDHGQGELPEIHLRLIGQSFQKHSLWVAHVTGMCHKSDNNSTIGLPKALKLPDSSSRGI